MTTKISPPESSSPQTNSVLLVIGGGIAAYKALELIRLFKQEDIVTRCVLSSSARQFVTPLSVASLSGQKVYTDLFSLTDESEMGHIELSRSADLVVVVPATADLLAKMANGLADDLASTLLLATDKKILAAPAMNLRMWLHPATQRNINCLRQDGIEIVGPEEGEMACGEFGPGRMAEPLEILAAAQALLAGDTHIHLPDSIAISGNTSPLQSLRGKRVVVTSGPTHEPIDPVRYLANRSSGTQGHAIASAAKHAGADVTLISGPVSVAPPPGVHIVRVETAAQMLNAAEAALPADIFVSAAAVADWRVDKATENKVKKKKNGPPDLKLVENPDILKTIASKKNGRPPVVVGFAAETTDLIQNAKDKLARKKCDLIVANDVSPETGIMGGKKNTVHLVTATKVEPWPELEKSEVASRLVAYLADVLGRKMGKKT